jgi:hypothetical protein
MPSLEILEGLIGTGCAVACLYYARIGALATGPHAVPQAAPWHSALGEYARRNPFAAVFGALALGFLASSWSMYIAPRAIALPVPHTVEKWHTITKNVPVPDPAQAAKIAALQTTINTDATMIAGQKAEIDRLKQLLGKSTARRSARSSRVPGGNTGATGEGTAAALNQNFNPANAAPVAAAPANPPPSATNTSAPNATSGAPTQTQSPGAPPASSDSTVPH